MFATLVASISVLLFAAAAGAQRPTDCESLPGRSGFDQYCESIPGETGPERPPGAEDIDPGSAGGSPDDATLAALVAADERANRERKSDENPPSVSSGDLGATSGSPLIWLIAALVLAAIAYALWRRHRNAAAALVEEIAEEA